MKMIKPPRNVRPTCWENQLSLSIIFLKVFTIVLNIYTMFLKVFTVFLEVFSVFLKVFTMFLKVSTTFLKVSTIFLYSLSRIFPNEPTIATPYSMSSLSMFPTR